jgi:septal ring factor EnvC (AmiA/AmiB activator)
LILKNHTQKTSIAIREPYKILCFAVLSILLFACASVPPSKTLPQSKVAVSSVDHAIYRKHVKPEVDAVKAKLTQAQNLEAEKQHVLAEQLAQQILVDVELIQIRTQRLNVEAEAKQIEDNISNLNEELKWREPVELSPLN